MINLTSIIFKLLKKDTAILYPAMIASFLTFWTITILKININNIKLNRTLLIYFTISWILNTFISLLTADLGKNIIYDQIFSFKKAFHRTAIRIIPALIGSAFILLLTGPLMVFLSTSQLLTLIFAPILIILGMSYILYPIVYILSEQNFWRIYLILFNFFKTKMKTAFHIFIFIIFIIGLKFLAISILYSLPANFKAVMIPGIEGLFNVIQIYAIIIFWLTNTSNIKIKI